MINVTLVGGEGRGGGAVGKGLFDVQAIWAIPTNDHSSLFSADLIFYLIKIIQ